MAKGGVAKLCDYGELSHIPFHLSTESKATAGLELTHEADSMAADYVAVGDGWACKYHAPEKLRKVSVLGHIFFVIFKGASYCLTLCLHALGNFDLLQRHLVFANSFYDLQINFFYLLYIPFTSVSNQTESTIMREGMPIALSPKLDLHSLYCFTHMCT